MSLHEGELPIDESVVVSLLREQRPEWAAMPLAPAGAGTDNVMFRLGDELLVRMPRTAGNATSLRKEREWMPRLAPRLPFRIPEPVHAGSPQRGVPARMVGLPLDRWPRAERVLGAGLVGHSAPTSPCSSERCTDADLMGAMRADDLSWYRGGSLRRVRCLGERLVR